MAGPADNAGYLPVPKNQTSSTRLTIIELPKGNQDMTEPQQRPAQIPVTVKDDRAVCSYANFCRVTGSPEELIIDFGLNSQPMGTSDQPIEVTQRIVVNFYTAKRLLHALHVSVQRHEKVFGNIETDIQKRVIDQQPA